MAPLGLSRREVLAAGATGLAGLSLPSSGAAWRRVPVATEGRFASGVASAAPRPHELLLWTRLAEVDRQVRVGVEVARDPDFRRVVHRATTPVRPDRDMTARVRVAGRGVRPGERYWYRFFTRDGSSAVGETRTACPADSREPVRIAFGSCQEYASAYFNAHAAIAAEDDLDLVVHLGDYTYDYGGASPHPGRLRDPSGQDGDGVAQTLPEYRDKLRFYRDDPDLQALHAAHPVLVTWDDHDVEVDWAGEDEGRSSAPRRVAYPERRRAAQRAFFEYLPSWRAPRLYGSVPLGAAELLVLDTRSYRTPIPCETPERGDLINARCGREDDPGNTMLGAAQKSWLKARLARSPAGWKVLANQIPMMGFDLIRGTRYQSEDWNGATAERSELVRHVLGLGVDAIVVTGDAHLFAAGQVTTDGRETGRPGMTEFVGGALSSGTPGGGLSAETASALDRTFLEANPHWSYANLRENGYGVLELRPDEARVTFKATVTRSARDARTRTLAEFRVRRGRTDIERVG